MRKTIIELIPNISEGGAETLVKDYCLFIDKDKFDIVVVTTNPNSTESANYNILLDNGINVISLNPNLHSSKHWFVRNLYRYTIHPIKTSFELRKVIKRIKPYGIHMHLRVLEYILRIPFSLKEIKLFYTCHNRPDFMFDHKRNLLELISCKVFCKMHRLQLIALHEDMRLELNKMFGVENTVVIHNGINFSRFNINESFNKSDYKQTIGIPNDKMIIGHIGRFSQQKNHNFLISIFDDVHKINPNTFLLMVGDGPLRKNIEDKLLNLGLQNDYKVLDHRKDIPELLNIMDVFLLPSNFEGLPVTMVEAQVVGLRCVVADNITTECYFSEKVIPLSINDSSEKWADVILDGTKKGSFSGDISVFNMFLEIKRIESLYLS